jgi:2-amino-4-hydroxy-6-hydroxymethyldihydropteridine diphosphokinase
MVRAAIALGSNLGDRDAVLRDAVHALRIANDNVAGSVERNALRNVLQNVRVSSVHETAYVGAGAPQPPYLNAAATAETSLPARALLDLLLGIEARFGRERPYPDAPRTLDLDLILYGMDILDAPGLIVPHPRFRQRRFVLAPLAEIAADWIDPVTGRTVEELLRVLDG